MRLERADRAHPFAAVLAQLDLDAAGAWTARYAFARALAESEESAAAFRPVDVGEAVGKALSVSARFVGGEAARRLIDIGLLAPSADGVRLAVGLTPWLCGGDPDFPSLIKTNPPAWLADLPSMGRIACAIAARAHRGSITVRAPSGALAAGLAIANARVRTRPIDSWRASGDSDEVISAIAAAAFIAEQRGHDVFVEINDLPDYFVFGPTGGRRAGNWRGEAAVVVFGGDGRGVTSDALDINLLPIADELVAEVRVEAARRFGAVPDGVGVDAIVRVCAEWDLHRAVIGDRPDRLRQLFDDPKPARSCGDPTESPPPPRRGIVETLDDLVVSDALRSALDAIAARGRAGDRCVALFHGPPGTGKSLAAQCLAGSLQRPIVHIAGSTVRSVWYGGEERILAGLFEAAATDGTVVVIDEADAWLARRDPHPGHMNANNETNALLMHLDRFRGIVILTTNRREVLDSAVHRRVDVDLAFDLPDPIERMALWSRALGDRPLGSADLMVLAAIPIAGGDIGACVREAGSGGIPALVAAARRRSEAHEAGG